MAAHIKRILLFLLSTLWPLAVIGIKEGTQGRLYSMGSSVVLIDTGYGMTPQFCSGVIISRYNALTSGVCCTKKSFIPGPPRVSVYAGSPDSWSDEATVYFSTDHSKLYHLGLRRPSEILGLCMVTVDTALNLTEKASPAVIPDKKEASTNKYLSFGFGSAEVGNEMPHRELKALEMTIVEEDICQKQYDADLKQDIHGDMTNLWCMSSGSTSNGQMTPADCGGPVFGYDGLLYGIALAYLKPKSETEPAVVVVPVVLIKTAILKQIKPTK